MEGSTKSKIAGVNYIKNERYKGEQVFSSSHKEEQRKFQIQELLHKQSEINKHSHNYLSLISPPDTSSNSPKLY